MILLKAKLEAIMKYSKYSTVIIGSGISGLYAALKIEQTANAPDGILVVTKSELGESNSKYAQGGMVGVLKENINDNPALHISDTIKAGAGLSEFNTVKFVSENSDKVIKDLLNFGVEFDCDENGELTYTLEAAHSVSRVLHSGGDATGRMIELALTKKVKENNNIDVYENNIAVDLLVSESECKGVIVFNDITKEYETIYSPVVILATGGIGQIYKYTTNPIGATGDGLALAYRAGLQLQDMEFVQFHPTALAIGDGNRFLISEAVRGEGAKLVNSDGIEFMQKYDDRKELAPRDIVTRANYNEMAKNNTDCVYLNATCISSEKLAKRFPTISKKCMENGIDISKDYIPVAPAAHYFMGGIKSDIGGATSVHGLFAIGETASTGLHGANRLASNSLLEALVFSRRAAGDIAANIKNCTDGFEEYEFTVDKGAPQMPKGLRTQIRAIMQKAYFVLPNVKELGPGLEKVTQIKDMLYKEDYRLDKDLVEARSLATVAYIVLTEAFKIATENAEMNIGK